MDERLSAHHPAPGPHYVGGSIPDPRYRLTLRALAMVRPLPLGKSWIRRCF